MAITQDQITDAANRLQVLDGLFNLIMGHLGNMQGTDSVPAKQIASQSIRTAIRAMKQAVADPLTPLPAPYSEAQIDQLATGLTTLREVASRLMQGLAKAQTPLLVDENGVVVRDYTQTQKDAMETELRRLYARLTTILNAAP